MRLVDIENLQIIRPRRSVETPLADALEKFLKELPTVEAIPVEWIEQYGKANWYDFGTQYNAITKMLEEWERLKRYDTD